MEVNKKVGRKKKYTEERKQLNIRIPVSKYNEISSLAEKDSLTVPELLDKIIEFGIQIYNMKK